MEEWEILRRFERHPNVINLMDVFETDEEIHLVLEYCRGGELFDAIRGRWGFGNTGRGLTEAQAAFITSQILTALADLHEAGIVHRDLKPENILISGSSPICVKLCDFGMARATVPAPSSDLDEGASASTDGEDSPVTPAIGRSFSIVGSNFYIAPEVVDGEGYSTSVDLYSLGVTLYLLLCGFPPVFTCEEGSKVLFPVDPDISEPAKQLVEKLLSSDPDERITAREALAHPWIQAHCSLCSTEMNPTSSRDANFSLHHHQTLATSDRHQGLEIMRQSLQQAIGKRGPCQIPLQLRSDKRVRRRASSCILAMADLYQEVTAPNAFEPCLVPTDSSSGRRVAGNDSRRSSLASRIVSGG
jgi:serine/threonine protein kinase